MTPAGLDRFFKDVTAMNKGSSQPDFARAEQLMQSYGMELLGLPLRGDVVPLTFRRVINRAAAVRFLVCHSSRELAKQPSPGENPLPFDCGVRDIQDLCRFFDGEPPEEA